MVAQPIDIWVTKPQKARSGNACPDHTLRLPNHDKDSCRHFHQDFTFAENHIRPRHWNKVDGLTTRNSASPTLQKSHGLRLEPARRCVWVLTYVVFLCAQLEMMHNMYNMKSEIDGQIQKKLKLIDRIDIFRYGFYSTNHTCLCRRGWVSLDGQTVTRRSASCVFLRLRSCQPRYCQI